MSTTITITDRCVHVQREDQLGTQRSTHHCATLRVAQLFALETELRIAGWTLRGLNSSDRARRPLLLPGESIGARLDGRRSDERAQGFGASRDGASIVIDACAGLPPTVLGECGDTTEARLIAEWYLGPLS